MSDIKQRKKSSDEEKRRRRRRDEDDHEERRRRDDDDDHEEKRRRRDEDDHEERRRDDDDDDDHEEKRRRRDEDDDDESRRDAMKSRSDHVKLMLTFMCLSVSLIMMWIVHQQNWRFAEMKEQYADLYEKTQSVLELQSQMSSVSHQCDGVHSLMSSLQTPPSVSQLESLDVEVSHLKERFSNLTAQRQQLQQNLTGLLQSLENTENRTLIVSNDVMSKVASIRTDVRRMAGLEGEAEALLGQTKTLEEKIAQVEKLMVKRMGDLLVGSIDRVSVLKSSTERNAQRLDQISKLIQELSTANRQLSERVLTLESSQAKMIKMSTFASDLKPKVFTIRQDFNVIDTQLADLTLRIGQIAEDVMRRDKEPHHADN